MQRPRRLVGVTQQASRALATLDDGTQIGARYLIGADGMHSTVREHAGIAFEGGSYGESFVLADVRLAGAALHDEVALYFSPAGMAVVAPLPHGWHRVVATVDEAPAEPDMAFVQALLDARGPRHHPLQVQAMQWSSRFRVHHRIADRYRAGRVLLAGDAAHVHSPAGGQGMNVGILDAMLLSQALVKALGGDEDALDAYGRQRRPVAQQVVALADRLTRLATVPAALRGARNLVLSVLGRLPAVQQRLAWRLSGLVYR